MGARASGHANLPSPWGGAGGGGPAPAATYALGPSGVRALLPPCDQPLCDHYYPSHFHTPAGMPARHRCIQLPASHSAVPAASGTTPTPGSL